MVLFPPCHVTPLKIYIEWHRTWNRWLEDVFPTEMVLFRGHVILRGCHSSGDIIFSGLETFENRLFSAPRMLPGVSLRSRRWCWCFMSPWCFDHRSGRHACRPWNLVHYIKPPFFNGWKWWISSHFSMVKIWVITIPLKRCHFNSWCLISL